jgi:uncharacterized iron-regulated membrane protein
MKRRRWFEWHSAIGCTAGLLLFVICWSGTFAVLSREVDWLIDPRLRAPAAEPISWGEAYEALRAAHPERRVTQLNAQPPGFALEAWTEDPDGVLGRLYADPRTGARLGATSYLNVQRFFRSLHMCLFLPAPWGYWIVGLLAAALLSSVATAIGFWRRFWRGVRVARWDPRSRRTWSDAHKLIGLATAWFALLIGFTGLWYLAEPFLPEPPEPSFAIAGAASGRPTGAEIERAVRSAERGGWSVRAIAFGEPGARVVELHGQDGSWLVRDRAAKVWIDLPTGFVVGRKSVTDLTPYERWIHTADPLHFGSFAGLGVKLLWFAGGLGLSALCLTGARLATRAAEAGSTPVQTRAAYVLTASVLACSCVAGIREVIGYAPAGESWPSVPTGVLGFIAFWIASTLAALKWWMGRVRSSRTPTAKARSPLVES